VQVCVRAHVHEPKALTQARPGAKRKNCDKPNIKRQSHATPCNALAGVSIRASAQAQHSEPAAAAGAR